MWIFLEDGTFYSAISHFAEPKARWIRARDRRSIDIFADWLNERRTEPVEVLELPNRDYDYRVLCTVDEWADYLDMKARTAKATNFKTEVSKVVGYQSKWMKALHDVWQVMYQLQWDLSEKKLDYLEDEDEFASFEDFHRARKAVKKGKKLAGKKSWTA